MNKKNLDNSIELQIKNNIAHVSLNRLEKHNALDMPMFNAIKNTINILRRDNSIRVIIVEGKGADFCSGLDIQAVMQSRKAPFKLLFKWLPWQANLAQYVSIGWRKIPVPVIMVIHGRCWGGGLQIALGGDFRIATPDASIAIMEARWGLIPDMGGTLALKELVKLDVAKELAMTGNLINGEQAFSYGLVTHIDEKPHERALKIAQEIALNTPDAIAAVKKLYNKSWWSKSGFILIRETYYQLRIVLGKNFRVKTYNQINQDKPPRAFSKRQNW